MCLLLEQVTELSRPSSFEVEEIIKQLAQNILQRFFTEDDVTNEEDPNLSGAKNYQSNDTEFCDSTGTSRDYLAKLLFWLVTWHLSVIYSFIIFLVFTKSLNFFLGILFSFIRYDFSE